MHIDPKVGFATEHDALYEQLIDIPKGELEKAFSAVHPDLGKAFQPGASVWDILSDHLGDMELAGEIPKFAEHLNKHFKVGN
jgi:hypothetical protein